MVAQDQAQDLVPFRRALLVQLGQGNNISSRGRLAD